MEGLNLELIYEFGFILDMYLDKIKSILKHDLLFSNLYLSL